MLIYVSMYLYIATHLHGMCGLAAGSAWEQFELHLKMTIEWTQRYTPRTWSSQFEDALGGRNWASLNIYLKDVIERVWRCTWRPWSSEFGDALGGSDRASLEMHLEAVIKQVWRYTWRPWSSKFGHCNRVSLDEYWEAVDGWRARCWDSFHQLVNSPQWECDKVTLHLSSIGDTRRKLKIHSRVNL